MAIDSVLNQEFADFEIICSDNASTDKTFQILTTYQNKDHRIKVFRNNENLGPVGNWQRCLENATGEYVHWLWSDDWIEPNFYVDAFRQMESDGTRVLSTWTYRSENPQDVSDKYLSWQFSLPEVPGSIAARKILLFNYQLPLSPAAYILPRDLVNKHFYTNIPRLTKKIDPVTNGVGVDSLMIIGCCLDVERISILKKPSVNFRKHDNLSAQLSKDGSLGKMYYWSHMWFLSENPVWLGLLNTLGLISSTFKILGRVGSIKQISILVIRAMVNSIFISKRIALPSKEYNSTRAEIR
jgi:glycosyltransferase involved in cell wall biosynthesis